jgi:eukaryotic-like serine/threonine-protein kinase
MTLASGSRLGPYEILGPLGAGAMGEVYRGKDSRLGREVAIKVLPEVFADDEERLARFEREARSLASLNHPNVAQIHGVDQIDDHCFLVLELVPGETLEERLARGPLRLDETLDVCAQIAEGLEAAHEAGVIHRGLKPANVRITPEGKVKLLDFGLAKPAREGAAGSTTDSVLSTEQGRLLGTPTYMAPEQARGKSIDRRVDVWALGCVLFECLTGKRAFEGETLSDVLAAVLEREPDTSRLPAATPARLRELLARCLAKDPRERLRDAGDARLELRRIARGEPALAPAARPTTRAALGAAFVAVFTAGAALAGLALWLRGSAAPVRSPTPRRFELHDTGMPVDTFQGLALSPDGRKLAYRAIREDGTECLHVRSFDTLAPTALVGTESGWLPFFSPDGERVGCFAQGSLKVVTIAGGIVRALAKIERGFTGATWLPDDRIFFAGTSSPAFGLVHASGGAIEYVDVPGLGPGQFVLAPWALPGGEALLCCVSNGASFDVAVFDLADRSLRVLAENGFTPTYAATGHVVFQQGEAGALVALPFDAERRVATGTAFPVSTDLGARVSYQVRMFALADDGTLVYVPKSSLLDSGALLWADRQGKLEPIFEMQKIIDLPRLSHDGKRIAFRAPAPLCEIWVHELERGVTTRVTHGGDNHGLAWSPDDERLAFAQFEGGSWRVVSTAIDAVGEPEPLTPTLLSRGFVCSYSPDGKLVLLQSTSEATGVDVELLDLADESVKPLLHSRFDERAPVFSPDGRFFAYVSNEEGRDEVYVQSFPALDVREKISTGGGTDPTWSPAGDELFFLSERHIQAVPVSTRPRFSAGRPKALFEPDASGSITSGMARFDVSADGQRFVVVRQLAAAGGSTLVVALDWFQELRAQAPAAGRQ